MDIFQYKVYTFSQFEPTKLPSNPLLEPGLLLVVLAWLVSWGQDLLRLELLVVNLKTCECIF